MGVDRNQRPATARTDQDVLNNSFDETFNILGVENLIYNEGSGTLDRMGAFGNVGYVLFDADDSAPTYIGINSNPDASQTADTWLIYKFTYSGSNATSIRKKKGAWTDRGTLF